MRLASVVLASALLSVASSAAFSATLPLIVDATAAADESAWWVEAEAPAGACLERLIAAAPTWINPDAAEPVAQVSRLLRRPDITATNAVSLAGLYQADTVVTGRLARVGEHAIAWTGTRRAAVVLTISTIDVSSGVSREWTGSRVAFASTDEEAVSSACGQLAAALSLDAPDDLARTLELPSEGHVLIRTQSGVASPFVALVTALREIHPAIIDVREVWATEGAIALEVELDEGARWDDVGARVFALDGRTLDGVRVLSTERDGERVAVWIDALPSDR